MDLINSIVVEFHAADFYDINEIDETDLLDFVVSDQNDEDYGTQIEAVCDDCFCCGVEFHAADFYDEDDIDEEELRELDELDNANDYYESEVDVARGEGFYIDEDGEWRPMDDEDEW